MQLKSILLPLFSKAIFAAGVLALAVFIIPQTAFAASTLHWTPFTEDPDTGDRTYGTELFILHGGTYEVPLNQLGEAFIHVDAPVFSTEGVLFFIPNPESPTPTREFVTSFGGFFFASDITFPQEGVYELDIYEGDAPVPVLNPLQRIFAWLFGTPAYAQNPELFIGTIRFTITEAGTEPTEPDPVIVLPGILGSRMKHGVWTLDPVLHAYDNLIETLVGNGYVYDQTVFPFPYDWTQSNEITAEALKEKIDAVKAQTDATKVDIVAHSMGGLVAREYIQSPDYEGDVDQLIFLGTPHLGAPLAYLMYEGGEADRTTEGFFFSLYLEHLAREAGFANAFDYIHLGNVESVRQLLLIYDYLFDQTNNLLDYPTGYPTNPFLESLNATSDQLSLNGVEVINIA